MMAAGCRRFKNEYYIQRLWMAEDMNVTSFIDNFLPYLQTAEIHELTLCTIRETLNEYCKIAGENGLALPSDYKCKKSSHTDSTPEAKKQRITRHVAKMLPLILHSEELNDYDKFECIDTMCVKSVLVERTTFLTWLELQ